MDEKKLIFRSDMADERVDEYKRVYNLSDIDGIKVTSENENNIVSTTVEVINEKGEMAVGKEIGKYITIELKDVKYLEDDEIENVTNVLSKQIKSLIKEDKKSSVLVIGLGNASATPDALGPKVVNKLDITRHLLNFAKEFIDPNTRSVSGISPGVLGTTGIETSEIVLSVVNSVNPDIVIAIDSLASSSVGRVGRTIQLSNTGITPGSGVRNKREGLNEKTLHRPVIAIGVPTVVDMATITSEVIEKLAINSKISEKLNGIKDIDESMRKSVISDSLDTENYIVTPKEIDELIDVMSDVVARSINKAM